MRRREAAVLAVALLATVSMACAGCTGREPDGNARSGPTSGDPIASAARTDAPRSVAATDAPFGLDPGLLPFVVDAADMLIVTSEGTERIGTSTGTIERTSLGSRPVIRLVLRQEFQLSTTADTLFVDPNTLLPLRLRHTLGELESAALDYAPGGRVTGNFTRMGEVTAIDTTLAGPVLDAAFMQPLISALPLAEGYSARIPVFHFSAGARTVSVRVVREGLAPYAGSQRPVWFVEYEGTPGRVITLAVDRQDRRMLRAESRIDSGRRYVQVTK